MRIAFITDYLGTLAGTEASICQSAECLRLEGHHVAVLVFPRDEPPHPHWLSVLAAANVDVFVLDTISEAHAADRAWQILDQWRPNVIHAIPMGKFMQSCLFSSKRFDCPIVATETSEASSRCTWYDETEFPHIGMLDAIVAPCGSVAKNLRIHFGYGGHIEVIPHLLHVPEPLIRPLDREALGRIHHLGSVTRLRFEKGISFLLAALALPTTPQNCHLKIFGETFEADRTQALIQTLSLQERIRIMGPFQGQSEMNRIYAAHPIIVLSSLFEGLPLALLNAIARGSIIVATDVGGVREIVGDDDAGIVVPPADPSAMSLAIRELVTDPELVLLRSRAAVDIFRSNFHISKVIGHTVKFYKELDG